MDLFEHVERKAPEPTVLSVEALTRAITGRLTAMGTVSVEGEVSQPKRAASGHLYFDLKDSGARISCIAWRSTVQRLGYGKATVSSDDELDNDPDLDDLGPWRSLKVPFTAFRDRTFYLRSEVVSVVYLILAGETPGP